jgi:uncharacterized membrane protein
MEGIEKASGNIFSFMITPIIYLWVIIVALSSVIMCVIIVYKAIKPKKYKLFVNGIEDKEAIITEIK